MVVFKLGEFGPILGLLLHTNTTVTYMPMNSAGVDTNSSYLTIAFMPGRKPLFWQNLMYIHWTGILLHYIFYIRLCDICNSSLQTLRCKKCMSRSGILYWVNRNIYTRALRAPRHSSSLLPKYDGPRCHDMFVNQHKKIYFYWKLCPSSS